MRGNVMPLPSPTPFVSPLRSDDGWSCDYLTRSQDDNTEAGHHRHRRGTDDTSDDEDDEDDEDLTSEAVVSDDDICVLEYPVSTCSGMKSLPKSMASNRFFNFERFGSLRDGPVIDLLSIQGFGLAVAIGVCAFVSTAIQKEAQAMLDHWSMTTDKQEAAMRWLEIPTTLCFFVGLVSDAFPILNSSRKAYMALGFVITFVSICGLFVASRVEKKSGVTHTSHHFFVVLLFAAIMMGTTVTSLASQTMVIEWSQRESVHNRGKVQASYLMLRAWSRMAGFVFAFCLVHDDEKSIALAEASYLCLAMLTLVATLGVVLFIDEEGDEKYLRETIEQKLVWSWKVVQQKAIWRTIWFIWCFGLFLYVQFPTPHDEIKRLCNMIKADTDTDTDTDTDPPTAMEHNERWTELLEFLAQNAVVILTFWLWRMHFLNTSWRLVFAVAPIMKVVPTLVLAFVTIRWNWIRSPVLYVMLTSMTGVTTALTEMMTIVPVTEVVHEGIEASTVGMMLTVDHTVRLFDDTLMKSLGSLFPDQKQPKKSGSFDSILMITIIVNLCINAFSAIGLHFLPLQKIDAQYLRVYGGFTKAPGYLMFGAFAVLVVYCIVANTLPFFFST